MVLTPKGIKPKVGCEVFAETLCAVRSTIEVRGLAPAPALQIVRSVAWSKIAHGAAVTLPCAAKLTSSWLGAARQVLCTFKQVHRAEVQRELGLLLHPVAWLCKAVIRVYGTALTTGRDPVLKRVLVDTLGSPAHPLRRGVEATLSPSGVTWEELAVTPVPDLLRKAEGRLREWSRQQLLDEAARLDLHRGANAPLWREWSDGPKKYLYEENARYGFMFRRSSFAPPDLHTWACHFCGCPHGDCGRHVLECDAVRAEVPLPEMLSGLSPQSLAQALLLEDQTPVHRLRAVLAYMKEVYAARRTRSTDAPQPPVRRTHTSNPDYFKAGRQGAARMMVATDPGARRRRRSPSTEGDLGAARRTRQRRNVPEAPPPTPSPPPTAGEGQPGAESDNSGTPAQLNDPCSEATPTSGPPAEVPDAVRIPCKRSRGSDDEDGEDRVAKRAAGCAESEPVALTVDLPTQMEISEAEPELVLAPPRICPQPVRTDRCDGKWTVEEEQQLAAAALVHGYQSASKLAKFVRTRTVRQIKVRLTTAAFRRSLERLSESRKTPSVQRPSESSATAHGTAEPALGGAPRPTPTPGLFRLGDTSQEQTVLSQGQHTDGRWTKEELDRLHEAARNLGHAASGEALSKAVGTRSARQCFDRLREKGTISVIGPTSLSSLGAAPGGCSNYRWEAEEVDRLVGAITELGGSSNPSRLAASVGSRTAAQVAAKVKDLVTSGKLASAGTSLLSPQ